MTYKDGIKAMIDGKCKGITRMDLPSRYYVTLWKYTSSYYSIRSGAMPMSKFHENRKPNWPMMYIHNAIDKIDRWINPKWYLDDQWKAIEVMVEL